MKTKKGRKPLQGSIHIINNLEIDTNDTNKTKRTKIGYGKILSIYRNTKRLEMLLTLDKTSNTCHSFTRLRKFCKSNLDPSFTNENIKICKET